MIGLLVSHGSPTVLVGDLEWKKTLEKVGKEIRETYDPDVVVVFSPHFVSWTRDNLIEVGERLKCIQDYYGFPRELYGFCYEAENDEELVGELTSFLKPDDRWGLDHGAWIPLYFMFPDGVKKAVTVSISAKSHEEHYELGNRIAQAAEKLGRRPLFLATSSPTHRLDLFWLGVDVGETLFDSILKDLINEGRFEEIVKAYRVYEREFRKAMPEGELKTLDMLLGAVKPKEGRVIAYDTPWPGVSLMLAEFRR